MSEERLSNLQVELQGLKQSLGRLHLSKAKGLGAPFPVTASLTVSAPSELHAYDLSGYKLVLILATQILASPLEEQAAGVTVQVLSNELPVTLKLEMAKILHSRWVDRLLPGSSGLQLASIFRDAHAEFLALVTSLPELVEAYESVDTAGASVRRYMINDPDSRLESQPAPTALLAPAPAQGSSGETAPATAGQLPSGLEPEVAYLQRRYRSAFLVTSTSGTSRPLESTHEHPGSSPLLTFTLELQPTDPAWNEEQRLRLTGAVAVPYPAPGSISLAVAESSHLSPDVCTVLERIIAAEASSLSSSTRQAAASPPGLAISSKPGVLRALIRRVENNAGEMMRLAEDVLLEAERRRTGSEVWVPFEPAQQQPPGKAGEDGAAGSQLQDQMSGLDIADAVGQQTSSAEVVTTDEYDSGSWTGDDGTEAEPSAGEAEARPAAGSARKLEGRVLELHLEGLKLDGVDALEPLSLQLQVACPRCGSQWTLGLATDAVSAGDEVQAGACGSCSQSWTVEMQPLLVHAHNSVIANIQAEGCTPLDLLPGLYAAQCGRCSSVASLRAVQIGQSSERTCTSCHLAMGVSFSSAAFVPKKAEEANSRQKPRPRTSGLTTGSGPPGAAFPGVLRAGEPLPAFGTCRHYPHSHRWLRFPCCGQRFPCDLCHEEGTDGHAMKWANRQVCGFCSVDQGLGDRCLACNKRLAHNAAGAIGAHTRHWEGGQGCRDRKRLDRRDRAKYRGSKAKTVSKKAFRVGHEGVAKRDRKAGS